MTGASRVSSVPAHAAASQVLFEQANAVFCEYDEGSVPQDLVFSAKFQDKREREREICIYIHIHI